MVFTKHWNKSLLSIHAYLLVRSLIFFIVLSPLSSLASTPPDSEGTTNHSIAWYAHASYFELYEVEPPSHLASLDAQVIEKKSWPSDTQVHYHLVSYITAVQEIEDDEAFILQKMFASACNINPERCSLTTIYNNGNLTNDGNWTQSWNYRNELTQSQKAGVPTVTYAYDHTGQRTKMVNGSSTTRYPNKLYNTDGTKNVKHIYAGDQVIATLENTTLQYVHTDHLTGSNAVTNTNAGTVQLMDYYPYGVMRIDWQGSTFDEQRKFTGHEIDRATNLTYANARYYKHTVGRFLSQDKVFLAVGDEERLKDGSGLTHRKYLADPQALNSYSYARNNPLKHVDKGGEFFDTVVDIGFIVYDAYKVGQAFATGGDVKGEAASLGLDVVGAVTPFATGLGMAARVARSTDKAVDAAKAVDKAMDAKKIWKVGDPINQPTRYGYPSWSTARLRYWKNEAAANSYKYSPGDMERMSKGLAPLDAQGKPYHLDHIEGRNIPDPHNESNLRPMTQDEHINRHQQEGYHLD